MFWYRAGYAALCVFVPAAWGLIVVWASSRGEAYIKQSPRAKTGEEPGPDMPPLDYHI